MSVLDINHTYKNRVSTKYIAFIYAYSNIGLRERIETLSSSLDFMQKFKCVFTVLGD